ncbi:MAG: cytochrome b N-terminal domain-containing protein [Thermoproteus sp.]
MILAVYAHGLHMMLSGGYKKPRVLQWVLGVLLFALTLGISFIGYSLTGDVLATDAVDVGRGILTSLGLQPLIPVLFGNGTELDLFTRLLGWHNNNSGRDNTLLRDPLLPGRGERPNAEAQGRQLQGAGRHRQVGSADSALVA